MVKETLRGISYAAVEVVDGEHWAFDHPASRPWPVVGSMLPGWRMACLGNMSLRQPMDLRIQKCA